MPTASREITVLNKLGLHARPAMQFVDVANQFTSRVTVYKGGEEPGGEDGEAGPAPGPSFRYLVVPLRSPTRA